MRVCLGSATENYGREINAVERRRECVETRTDSGKYFVVSVAQGGGGSARTETSKHAKYRATQSCENENKNRKQPVLFVAVAMLRQASISAHKGRRKLHRKISLEGSRSFNFSFSSHLFYSFPFAKGEFVSLPSSRAWVNSSVAADTISFSPDSFWQCVHFRCELGCNGKGE